ncbi:MAG: hypothetical protein ACRC0L_07225 [Angustibacter sp.]
MNRTGIVSAISMTLMALTPVAHAAFWEGGVTGASGSGVITISDKIYMSGNARDTQSDGGCARIDGNFDIPINPDHRDTIKTVCGSGTTGYFNGWSHSLIGSARDFEIYVCRTNASCAKVWEGDTNDA